MCTLSKEEASSSTSSATLPWEYIHDVFLSFRGEDTRMNFTDHLYNALKQKDINTFRDDVGLEKGKPISELFKAIEESRFAVTVFSKNYANSKWCLKELAKIVECMEKRQMIVLPIFYLVNPSDVRNHTGTFAKFFAQEIPCKREECSMEEEEMWIAVLKKLGSLIGWHLRGDRPESEFIRQIVENILEKLHDKTKGYSLLAPKLVGQAFQRNLDKIWESLMKDDVLSIGIHGMGGVGKTTLVMHIHNRLLDKPDSFSVYWITVSQDFNIKKLQNDIAKAVNLDLSYEDDEKKRAAKLEQALTRKKNLILILDDVWKCFDLEKVGIRVKVNGCKLILTTRSLDVCRMMVCQEIIRVEPLNKDEAWKLFMEKFGHDIALPAEIKDIARSIAKECAGLPLGIITMARSMRGVDIHINCWRNALEELKNSKAALHNVEDEVFQILKFSYSSLKDPKLQECFLFCSLYPVDFKIERDELIERLIDERIIERKKSRQAEYDKGHDMLTKLQHAYLLERFEDETSIKYVKMHDLLRDMAIWIARDSQRYMIEAGMGLRDLPDDEEWKDALIKVSLMSNKFLEIPSNASPRCSKLSTLMLNHNNFRGGISNSFFMHMSGLKVLNLSYTIIKDLPDSVSNLENLTALVLRKCKELKHVPSLAKLTALRKLDLGGTKIRKIPQGLEMLVNLRYLNLYCWELEIFPTGILPKFSHLQYLVITWLLKVKGDEVASLKKLETFKGQLYNIHEFNTYVRYFEEGKPNNYILQVGEGITIPYWISTMVKSVILSRCSISKSRIGEHSLVLPKDVQDLILYGIDHLRSLCDVPSFNNAAELNILTICSCKGIDHILSSSSFSSCILPLQNVNSLWIGWLDNLRVLIREERAGSSPVPPGTFSRLKNFNVFYCENIKKLFMPELLLHLHSLEQIDVDGCNQLVEIIGVSSNEVEEDDERNKEEGMDTAIFSLPKLRVLKLRNLPELKSICTSNKVMVFDSIQNIEIVECRKLKRIPLSLPLLNGQLCPPPSLKHIYGKKEWWESLEWDHPNSKIVLRPFFYFYKLEEGRYDLGMKNPMAKL